jgi:2-hydroxy-6-oxonona-2,4-dienedioate hydrolase
MTSIWNHLQGVEFRQSYYSARGVRTRALEAGSGPPLVFLHGTGGHAEAYVKNIAAHARHFHVYAIDMVGHGYSDKPELAYDMQCYVDHLRGFVDAIGAGRIHVSGESLGATVAAWFSIQHADRIEKIVMNSGMLLPPDAEGARALRDLLELSRNATLAPDREAVRARLRWLMRDPASVTEELVETRFRIDSQPGRAAVMRAIAEQSIGTLLDPERRSRWYSAELLRRIRCPVLVLWTRHNPGQGVALAEAGARLIANAEIVILERSANWPQWEEPEEFDRVSLEFLLK